MSASLTLGLSSVFWSAKPPRNLLILRLNFSSSSSGSSPFPSPPSGGPEPPLFLAPVVRHDAFYALRFCLAVRVYVHFSPHLSRGSTSWVGVGGWVRVGGWGGLNSVLSPSSCHLRFDTLPMLRSIDLLLGVGVGVGGGLIAFCRLLPVASSFRHAPDVTLYRSSLAILDTLPMLRSIGLLLQSSTRS